MNENPIILTIDDNEKVLENLRAILELNNYRVITANSAEEALEILEETETDPDLVICDIMLPKISGIDFFKLFSTNRAWIDIPFVFLTGLKTSKDIRKGKALGVDDYLTKPIDKDEILAVIEGKLKRKSISERIREETKNLFKTSEHNQRFLRNIKNLKESIVLFIVAWDDKIGPQLEHLYPKEPNITYSIQHIGKQLYQCSRFIYGVEKISEPEGILLNLTQIDESSYLYFDSYPDPKQRSGRKQYMIGVIAPNITYFETRELKNILKNVSYLIKTMEPVNLKPYWDQISEILKS